MFYVALYYVKKVRDSILAIVFLFSDIVDQGDMSTNENGLADADKDAVGRWYGSRKITFMAYLSRNQLSMTRGQHIKFDRVLLNDGNAYNAHTGVFTYVLFDNNFAYDSKLWNNAKQLKVPVCLSLPVHPSFRKTDGNVVFF